MISVCGSSHNKGFHDYATKIYSILYLNYVRTYTMLTAHVLHKTTYVQTVLLKTTDTYYLTDHAMLNYRQNYMYVHTIHKLHT